MQPNLRKGGLERLVSIKTCDYGAPIEAVERALARLELTMVPFDEGHAVTAAAFRPQTRNLNLSFAYRAC
jgi:hypothetical protein